MFGQAFHLQWPTTPPAATVAAKPPGPQSPGVQEVMDADFFASAEDWQERIVAQPWDFIVVGSGCTALAFVDVMCRDNPNARILVLERGPFWLTQHFQNTPLPFKYVLGGLSETTPWTLAQPTIESEFGFMHGSCPFLGGRSNFWSAWSPTPTPALMRDWPAGLVEPTQQPQFWDDARALLNVITADQIGDPVYAELQAQLGERLPANLSRYVPTAQEAYPAPLAVGNPESIDLRFNKFSVPGPLLALKEIHDKGPGVLEIVTRCIVERLVGDNGTVTQIATSRGPLPVGNAQIILAAGAVPPATLLMNSFPDLVPLAGTRLCAHFLTHIAARVPRAAFASLPPEMLQIAAMYVAGLGSTGRQYHVQVTAIASPNAERDAVDAARECPDYAAAATAEQLADSADYVVFVCATLGETDETNPDNWVRRDAGADPTDNVTLQMVPDPADQALWDEMDDATVGVIEAMADPGGGLPPIEYWHPTSPDGAGFWSTDPLSPAERRIPGLVHEAGPLFMGDAPEDSVTGPDFRPWGIANVYVTGAGLFPTSGSWNPTLTMCGLAQTLAGRLAASRSAAAAAAAGTG